MFIELSEILLCPVCRPRHGEGTLQGLVAVVEELRDRKVLGGRLGCPACEARYPIRDGIVRFGLSPAPADEPVGESPSVEGDLESSAGRSELALAVAALLSLQEVTGYLLLGQGLGPIAEELSRWAPGCEVIALSTGPGAAAEDPSGRVTWLSGLSEGSLPFRSGSVSAAALAVAGVDGILEAARVLRAAGPLVLLGPASLAMLGLESSAEREPDSEAVSGADPTALPGGDSEDREARVLSLLRASGFEPVAADSRAIVARRA